MRYKSCKDKKWAHITKADWTFARSAFSDANVYLSLIDIKEIDKEMIVKHGYGDIFINQPGMKWIQVIPESGPYWFTAMFSKEGEFLQLYIDIVGSIDFKDPEDPVMEDMYLDIIMEQDRKLYLVDRDELDAVYQEKVISAEEYRKAIADADNMMRWLTGNAETAVKRLENWYRELQEKHSLL